MRRATKVQVPGEAEILARIGRRFRADGTFRGYLKLGIGDDAALFRPRQRCETVLSSDWFLEGIHFLRQTHSADSVGWKCLARALSDLAAMGAVPRCFLLNLAFPGSLSGSWLEQFLRGLRRASSKFACLLAGGDTTNHEKVLINITVIGEVTRGLAGRREGAKPGDRIYVSGTLGEAEAGLRLLRIGRGAAGGSDPRLKKHLYPEPRLALGQWLVKNRIATAMMDLSDGLSSDLPRLCGASGVGARIESQRIPVIRQPGSTRGRKWAPLQLALHGGDDYELLFTVRPDKVALVPKAFHGLPLSDIGEITSSRKIVLLDENGTAKTLDSLGWDPFARR